MNLFRLFKRYLYTAFREIFIYHHSSLEFRAKIYAFFIVATGEPCEQYTKLLEEIAEEIYHDTPDRASTLIMTVREYGMGIYAKKVHSTDKLLKEINLSLKAIPRYALKIEISHLRKLQRVTHLRENIIYQDRIIEYFENKRKEYENSLISKDD